MPNWITNRVTLHGADQKEINKVIDFLRSKESEVDFNNIIPMPIELRNTEAGSRADYAWAYYHARELGDFAEIDKMLGYAWVKREGIKTRDELFYSTCTLEAHITTSNNYDLEYLDEYDSNYACKGFILYDLLPEGAMVYSSPDEIKKSVKFLNYRYYILDTNFKNISSKKVLEEADIDITITENYNNTGRTMLKIRTCFSEPIYLFQGDQGAVYIDFNFKMAIPYDSYIEYGNIWKNYCYLTSLENQLGVVASGGWGGNAKQGYTTKDNGSIDPDVYDINNNGDDTETIAYSYDSMTITSVVSTHQDVQTQVQTVNDNFTVGKGTSPYNEEYTYKLRVRTGQNAATK